jgi:hypothetical protein
MKIAVRCSVVGTAEKKEKGLDNICREIIFEK